MKAPIALGLLAVGLATAPLAQATQWHATAGAQSADLGHQALAFLPDEIWIHAGDSVTWSLPTDEIHTVSLLVAGEVRQEFFIGCPPGPPPGITPSGSSFDGSACINSGPLAAGQSYRVKFPKAGNYKLVCLVHEAMTAVVHVLPLSRSLPHGQAFYDDQAERLRNKLLAVVDKDGDIDRSMITSSEGSGHPVIAGAGRIVATPGGQSTVSLMRFMQPVIRIHAGGTVEWGDGDPVTPHTITLGTEPSDPTLPSANVHVDADGALHGTINSPADSVNSGLLQASELERNGVVQASVGITRFRVTFRHAGTYPYICALHDALGMKGKVIVDP